MNSKKEKLDKLRSEELTDKSLPLSDTAKNLVFGEGNPSAPVLFLGEAPGRFEDEKGLPFVGAAGKILDGLLKGIGLERDDVFISSVLHYRPPKNRQPKPAEIEAFSKYVDGIIEIIRPKVIATLGNFSLHKFLPDAKISLVHGKPEEVLFKGIKITIVPLYHPAAVLYRRNLQKTLEEDFNVIKKLLKEMGR
jgi:uracil-DNA glycosylase